MATAKPMNYNTSQQSNPENIPSTSRENNQLNSNVGRTPAVGSNSDNLEPGGRATNIGNGIDQIRSRYMSSYKVSILTVSRYTGLSQDVIISKIQRMENQGIKITTETLLDFTLEDNENDNINPLSCSPNLPSNVKSDDNHPAAYNSHSSLTASEYMSGSTNTSPNSLVASSTEQISHNYNSGLASSGYHTNSLSNDSCTRGAEQLSSQIFTNTSRASSSSIGHSGTVLSAINAEEIEIDAEFDDVVDGTAPMTNLQLPKEGEDVVDVVPFPYSNNAETANQNEAGTLRSHGNSGSSSEVVSRIKETSRQPTDPSQSSKSLNILTQVGVSSVTNSGTETQATAASQDLKSMTIFENVDQANAENTVSRLADSVQSATVAKDDSRIFISLKLVRKENELLEECRHCTVCGKNPRDITFLPCGHFTSCRQCAGPLYSCPLCRKDIRATVDTYLS